MKPIDSFEKLIRDLHVLDINTSAEVDQRILHDTLKVQKEFIETKLAGIQPDIWRIIMKSSITKLAATAIVIVVVVLGLFEFIKTKSMSGVVWADVVKKVEACQGVIYRTSGIGMGDPNDDWPAGHIMHYKSPLHSRTDWHRGEHIRRTVHFNLSTKTVVWLAHDANVFAEQPMKDETVQSVQSSSSKWMDPEAIIARVVSHEHRKLGTKNIDGILCEGIETTDPAVCGANYPVKAFRGQLWVSTETGYPVRIEAEIAAGEDGSIRQTAFADQFQWNVEFSQSDREISIPPDFSPLE